MLIVMSLDSPRNDIDEVKKKIIANGCKPHEIPGEIKLAIGITGPTHLLKEEDFQVLRSVQEVVRVTKKFKLASRMMKNEDTVINIDGTLIGGKELFIVAGPCSVESKDLIFEIAESLKENGINFLRAGAYKPRSSPYAFQGLKEKGIEYLAEVKEKLGMKIVTEVLDQSTVESISNVADIIQIGARNMQNFSLLEQVGKLNKPILLKRGLSATVEELLMSAEYIISQDNYNVILCERGIRTFENSTRNTLDLNAIPVIKKQSHLPVISDPSHGIGIGEFVPSMALASIAAGADGLIIEVHQRPSEALSDGFQSLDLRSFKDLLLRIKDLAKIIERSYEI